MGRASPQPGAPSITPEPKRRGNRRPVQRPRALMTLL
jgi:hypothetical protein